MSTSLLSEAEVAVADVNVFDPQWWVDGPPHELFKRMRDAAPVHWNPLPDGTGCWALFRHADISTVSHDSETFSSAKGGVFINPDQLVNLDVISNMLLYMDPPTHTRYRKIVAKVFTPASVAKLEEGVRARVAKTIDNVIEAGKADFAADIAVPIPLHILMELMGAPEEDLPKFYDWTERIEQGIRATESNTGAVVFGEMAGYLAQQVMQQMEAAVEDSLVMRLRNAEVDGEKLNDLEIVMFFGLLTFAGNDTTRNTAAAGLRTLIEHPDALNELYDDPSLIPNAIEELLRWTSVVQWFARTATRDVELGGKQINAGDKVVMWYGSGSRDEAVFENADTFDIHRPKPDHMAFGGGRHFCLGASLARLELRVIFEEVLGRMKDLRLDGTPELVPSNWAYGLSSLPVAFTPGPRTVSS